MTDTARDYQTLTTADTNGMDDFFVEPVGPSNTRDDSVALTQEEVAPTEGIPVEEAAKLLGLSVKTIKDRLRKGTLQGFKQRQKFGDRWMVCLGRDYLVVRGTTEDVLSQPEWDGVVAPLEGGPAASQNLDALVALLAKKDQDLQAATWRNGYLEAILSEKNAQLKLLPDYQSKASEAEILLQRVKQLEEMLAAKAITSKWAKFSRWFFKAQ
jgi:hypothetical protein